MNDRRFAVAVPTVVPHGLLDRCLEAVVGQQPVAADALLIENGPEVATACALWEREWITVYRPGKNLGVAASWNYACRWAWERGHHAILLLNDDLTPRSLYVSNGPGWDDIGTAKRS
jgi:GT2 family glycosyltransferase